MAISMAAYLLIYPVFLIYLMSVGIKVFLVLVLDLFAYPNQWYLAK